MRLAIVVPVAIELSDIEVRHLADDTIRWRHDCGFVEVALRAFERGKRRALDTTIANVALPHMRAAPSASQDEVSWVLTSTSSLPPSRRRSRAGSRIDSAGATCC
jgi:hypothetical protein